MWNAMRSLIQYVHKILLHSPAALRIISPCAKRWVWPSWLRRQIVALEIVGSSPIIHPSALGIWVLRFRNACPTMFRRFARKGFAPLA